LAVLLGVVKGAAGSLALPRTSLHGNVDKHRRLQSRHASGYLDYEDPLADVDIPRAWFNSLWPKHSSESTFFATNGHGFGYMGLQQVEDRGLWFLGQAIFSIWDEGGQQAEVVECGELAVCTRFGGEGTGWQSTLRFNQWELEQPYGFLVEAFDEGSGKVRLDGYLHAPELGGWRLLSKLRVSVGAKPWYLHGMFSFVEQWDERSGEDVRWGRFGGAFVEAGGRPGNWTQMRRAAFRHTSATGEDTSHVYANVTDNGRRWGLGIGGALQKDVAQGTTLEVLEQIFPLELEVFTELRRTGRLPIGCAGGTCTWTAIRRFFESALTKKYFPISVIALLLVCACSCFTCLLVYRVRRRRKHCAHTDICDHHVQGVPAPCQVPPAAIVQPQCDLPHAPLKGQP